LTGRVLQLLRNISESVTRILLYNRSVTFSLTDSPRADTPLTDEQRAIVAHDYGPALVFAVAGAGKTTAMTYRIERLVREKVFPARALLATSFSKASVRDIKQALARWPHCAAVPVQTLHAVGWGLLRLAQRRGHLPELALSSEEDNLESQLLGRVLSRAWREKVSYAPELEELDRQDFLTYVGVMKANLWYANLDEAKLPPAAKAIARQAPAPPGFPWYRDFYGLYERVRAQENVLTFDDMLLSGWECLHRFPDVLEEARRRFRCVLVDEFQDVNRVQSEMLDLLTAPDRHYMAIGDDDQTIYEWRGADPSLILTFARRYEAARYYIHDNFRSHAAPLALANRVIEKNKKREPKHLSLTRGFAGTVSVHGEDSPEQQGRHVAALIGEALASGHRPDEIAVLVRLYAQTPYLEQALLEASLPYRVIGSSPFYARPEVLTLLDYLKLAQGGGADWETRWFRIANKPTRYLSRIANENIAQAVRQGASLAQALSAAAKSAPDHLAARLLDLAETLAWLAGALHTLPAGAVLTLLDQKIGYTDYLRRSSGFPETGAARAASVEAFRRYAHGLATPAALLAHLDDLAARGVGQNRTDDAGSLALLTVFRAKGLQWPIVFVPDCNQGIFPYGGLDEIEEERRLFYVALTRTQSKLHLHVVKTEPPSQFLAEADWQNTLNAVSQVETLLTRDPAAWQTGEVLALLRHTPDLGLTRFFQTWWHVSPAQANAVAGRLLALLEAARRQNLILPLGLTDAHRAPWAAFGPFPTPDPEAFPDLAAHAPALPEAASTLERTAFRPGAVQVGGQVQHAQHGRGTILAVRGDRLSPRLEIQFARGKPVVLPAKFVELVGV
jgi:DNA helicase-2/ATP-dependent DNA helicase PcrA